VNILIADDHPLFVEALKIWLMRLDDHVCFDIADHLDAIIKALQSDIQYDLVLLDLSMPGMEGITEAVRYICNQSHATPVVVVSSQEDRAVMRCCMEAGASGYLCKSLEGDAMLNSLQSVLAGYVVSPKFETIQTKVTPYLNVTQIKILNLINQGLSNQQIAHKLEYTLGTIKQYVSTILLVLDVDNRVKAVNKARFHGLL